MKKLLKLLTASALSLGLYSTPAQAGWQYTEWGMSPDEVIAVANMELQEEKSDYNTLKNITVLKGVYNVEAVRFKLRLNFKENKQLELVELQIEDPSFCVNLPLKLISTYGEGIKTSDILFNVTIWHDQKNNNLLKLLVSPELVDNVPLNCFLSYSPIPDQNTKNGF